MGAVLPPRGVPAWASGCLLAGKGCCTRWWARPVGEWAGRLGEAPQWMGPPAVLSCTRSAADPEVPPPCCPLCPPRWAPPTTSSARCRAASTLRWPPRWCTRCAGGLVRLCRPSAPAGRQPGRRHCPPARLPAPLAPCRRLLPSRQRSSSSPPALRCPAPPPHAGAGRPPALRVCGQRPAAVQGGCRGRRGALGRRQVPRRAARRPALQLLVSAPLAWTPASHLLHRGMDRRPQAERVVHASSATSQHCRPISRPGRRPMAMPRRRRRSA